MLELDHVLCFVPPDGAWPDRLAGAGWRLDDGTTHAGQGTRNRRLIWPGRYLELAWLYDRAEAAENPLRLDRRAEWTEAGASPFGFGLRGTLPEELRGDYWLYDGLPLDVWVHRDNEEAPERPLVFVLDLSTLAPEAAGGRSRSGRPTSAANPGSLRAVRHSGSAPARLPPFDGPAVEFTAGPHRLELVVDGGRSVDVTDIVSITA